MLFLCWNSQSFHLHTGGVSRFSTKNIPWTGSFCTFIVHGRGTMNGFENGPNLAENRIENVLQTFWDWNSIYFSANRARPGSQNLPKMGLRNRISKKDIRIRNNVDCVEGERKKRGGNPLQSMLFESKVFIENWFIPDSDMLFPCS